MVHESQIITDDEICYQIINHYGSETEKEVMDKLGGLIWDKSNISKGTYEIIDKMLTDYMVEVVNRLYLKHKDDKDTPWFIDEAFDN